MQVTVWHLHQVSSVAHAVHRRIRCTIRGLLVGAPRRRACAPSNVGGTSPDLDALMQIRTAVVVNRSAGSVRAWGLRALGSGFTACISVCGLKPSSLLLNSEN